MFPTNSQSSRRCGKRVAPSSAFPKRVLALLAATFCWIAAAETMDAKHFSYAGGPVPLVLPVWNPSHHLATRPGFQFQFWGAPDPAAGCVPLPTAVNGETENAFAWSDMHADTGLGESSTGSKWTPKSSSPLCTTTGWQGITHAHVNTSTSAGGFGLYTHAGPKPWDASPSFWQPNPESGDRNGRDAAGVGINRFIQDTGALFRFEPQDTSTTRPFSSLRAAAGSEQLRFAFISQQHVEKLSYTDGSAQQVRQQMKLMLLNPTCLSEGGGKSCQIELRFYTAIAGLNASGTAEIGGDPAQDGLPSMGGRIPPAGQTLIYADGFGETAGFFTSWAEPTQNAPWTGSKKFQVEISFNQFQGILRAATARKDVVRMSAAADCTKYFGSTCNMPNAWQLLQIGSSQEVYNSNLATRAFVGGSVSELTLLALPLE